MDGLLDECFDDLDNAYSDLLLRLDRRCTDVRSEDHIGQLCQRGNLSLTFVFVDVQGRAAKPTSSQGGIERLFIHHPTPGKID